MIKTQHFIEQQSDMLSFHFLFLFSTFSERKITQQYFEEYFCALKLSTKNPSRINDQPSWNPRDYRTILTTHSNNDHEETIISSLNQSVTSEDSPTMETALIPIDNRHLFLSKYRSSFFIFH